MTAARRVGVIGGTFDPIHLGHLAVAEHAARALDLHEVRFLPSRIPPHRPEQPIASGFHRFAMVALAIVDDPRWTVSDVELTREGPSYTFDTLQAMHAEGLAPPEIFFVTGADAFAEIATWSRYPAVLDHAHFVVVSRPGSRLDELQARLPALAPRMVHADLRGDDAAAPRIVLLEAATPDVSSTEIRQRARDGVSIERLVPPRVAAHIARHGLYRP